MIIAVSMQIDHQRKAMEIWSAALAPLQDGSSNRHVVMAASVGSAPPLPPASPPPASFQHNQGAEYTSFQPEDGDGEVVV
jgi:hypothetical protein